MIKIERLKVDLVQYLGTQAFFKVIFDNGVI